LPIISNQLTSGVGGVYAPAHGVASGGEALFSENFATLWNDNVLTVLDVDAFNDTYWNDQDNAAFAQNVAEWVATATVPIPAAAWLFGSGLIGLVGMARRKAAKKASARGCTRRRLVARFPNRVFSATHRTLHPCAVMPLLSAGSLISLAILEKAKRPESVESRCGAVV